MALDLLGIEIPQELLLLDNQNEKKTIIAAKMLAQCSKYNNKKIQRNERDEVEVIDYYDLGELTKQVYFQNSVMIKEKRYCNNRLIVEECYSDGYITSKISYDKNENIRLLYEYKYDNEKKIISITKKEYDKIYTVNYGYDNLDRVNFREIIIDNKIVQKQQYRIDVLDRVIEYIDNTQRIVVSKISANGKLISYKITDISGNQISINNYINFDEYINTTVSLNGHETTVNNSKYLENEKLLRPTATQDDLNKIISLFENNNNNVRTTRQINKNIVNNTMITNNINKNLINCKFPNNVVPITLRKKLLYEIL